MQLSTLRQHLEDSRGEILSATDEEVLFDRVLNAAYKKIAGMTEWWWMEKQAVIPMAAVPVKKTMAATNGSTDLTPNAGEQIGTSYINGWVHTGEHSYRITDIASGSPYTVTLDSDFIEASGDYDFEIWQDTYDAPADFGTVISAKIRAHPGRKPLTHVTMEEVEAKGCDLHSKATSFPYMFSVYRESDKESTLHIRVYPPPQDKQDLHIRYYAEITEMSSDSDEPLLPERFSDALIDLARLRLAIYDREPPDIIAEFKSESAKSLSLLWGEQNKRGAVRHRVRKRFIGKPTRVQRVKLINTESGI